MHTLVDENDVLYIILDGDKCRKNHHEVRSVLLLIKYKTHIQTIAGQYCETCKQSQIRRNDYAGLHQDFGKPLCRTFLKGLEDVIFEEPSANYPDYWDREYKERAIESDLRKLGYSVANNSGLSEKQRQSILQNVIEHGIKSKGSVIAYLENNIRINGRKETNSVAVYKWKRDLEFVRQLSDCRYEKK